MATKEQLMKESKETLAERLANRSNGNRSSRLIPVSSDGVKLITAGQEIGLIGCAFENVEGGPNTPYDSLMQGIHGGGSFHYRDAIHEYISSLVTLKTTSGKILWGSTAFGLIGGALKKKGRTIRAGILKLN